ncbi:S-receptor-like serine/threonine-protein kinase [Melia azedarach]|uniref:S-receptor-like serine/threonine-protein kinase n=1 Tax=Melia azedarach TaxID=155640 RepID=A0ACC1Y5Y9_MELAZ|nr:S-receptor-like serine/threonine-protein kinase [Melia azedarach]
MDRFAFFIIVVAIASVVYLILAFTVASSAPTGSFVISSARGTVAILGLIIYCVRRKPRNKGKRFQSSFIPQQKSLACFLLRGGFDLQMNLEAGNTELNERNKRRRGRKKEVDELPFSSFSSVSAATNKFSHANKLGEGGFGPVTR